MLIDINRYSENFTSEASKIFKNWCLENKIVYHSNNEKFWIHILYPRLKGIETANDFPLAVHKLIFQRANGSRLWVIQPYKTREELEKAGILEWAAERGLKVKMSYEDSWLFPGLSILAQFEVDDESKFRKYVEKHRVFTGRRYSYIE